MLHIVLLFLKIIGIILASILGLLLFLILVVLLVPIRYKINADNKDEIKAEAIIGWLLRIIYIRIFYSNNQIVIKLLLFGKIFYDSSKLKEKKPNKNSEEPRKLKKSSKKNWVKTKESKELQNKIRFTEIVKAKPDIKPAGNVTIQRDKKLSVSDETQSEKKLSANGESQPNNKSAVMDEKQLPDKPPIDINKQINLSAKVNEKILIQKNVNTTEAVGYTEAITEYMEYSAEDSEDEKQKGVFTRIKQFFIRIKEFFIRIKNWFQNLKPRIINLKEKIVNIGEKWSKIRAFLSDEENKKAFLKSFKTLKRILKHVRPAKLRMELEFGTGDPCSTGQALGVLAMFYGYYGKSMQVIPNFEEEIFKGSIFCIGRIRLSTLLIICIKLILDKNFKKLLKNFKTLKEDL